MQWRTYHALSMRSVTTSRSGAPPETLKVSQGSRLRRTFGDVTAQKGCNGMLRAAIRVW
jgi:hypothetical protein